MYHYKEHPSQQICPGCMEYMNCNVGIPVIVTHRGRTLHRQVHDAKCLERARERVDVVLDTGGAEAKAWQQTIQVQTA